MAVIENSVEIARPVEAVFDFVVDFTNELKWNPAVKFIEKLTDAPAGQGTRYRAQWAGSPIIEAECTRAERPTHVTLVNGGPISVTLDLSISPIPGGSRMDAHFDATPHGFMRLLFPIFLIILCRQEQANMAHLKAYLESH
jgi:uncharacterized protein YndB with AHSA1/START domain